MSKTLIAYFSTSGETARLAKTLAGVTGGDLFEIKPQTKKNRLQRGGWRGYSS